MPQQLARVVQIDPAVLDDIRGDDGVVHAGDVVILNRHRVHDAREAALRPDLDRVFSVQEPADRVVAEAVRCCGVDMIDPYDRVLASAPTHDHDPAGNRESFSDRPHSCEPCIKRNGRRNAEYMEDCFLHLSSTSFALVFCPPVSSTQK